MDDDFTSDDHDAHAACEHVYDHAAEAISLRSAFLPGYSAGYGQALALATHFIGEWACRDGSPTPPMSYGDAKIGYDPATETPPTFAPDHHNSDHAEPSAFDFRVDATHDGPGLTYDDPSVAYASNLDYSGDNFSSSASSDAGGDSGTSGGSDGTG